MANEKTLKKITLHPISNGQQDDSVDLLSKTSINNILSGSVDIGGEHTFNAGFVKELKYDSQAETIKGLENGKEYYFKPTFTKEFLDTITPSLGGVYNLSRIYHDPEYRIRDWSYYDSEHSTSHYFFGIMSPNIANDATLYYNYLTEQWINSDTSEAVDYETNKELFKFVFDLDKMYDTNKYKNYNPTILKQCIVNLDGSAVEDITTSQEIDLEDKVADVSNWAYSKDTSTKLIKNNIDWEVLKPLIDDFLNGSSSKEFFYHTSIGYGNVYKTSSSSSYGENYYIYIRDYVTEHDYYYFENAVPTYYVPLEANTWYDGYNWVAVEPPISYSTLPSDASIYSPEITNYLFEEDPNAFISLNDNLVEIHKEIDNLTEDLNSELKDKLYENVITELDPSEVGPSPSGSTVESRLRFNVNTNDLITFIENSYSDKQYSEFEIIFSDSIRYYHDYSSRGSYSWQSWGFADVFYFTIDGVEYEYELRKKTSNGTSVANNWFKKVKGTWIQQTETDEMPLVDSLFQEYWYPQFIIYKDNGAPDFTTYSRKYSGVYKLDVTDSDCFTLLESEPEAWRLLYKQCYTYNSTSGEYEPVSAAIYVPSFETDTYYWPDPCVSVYEEPEDWSYNYYDHYYSAERVTELLNRLTRTILITPQTLEEKFEKIEEEIQSHTDNSYLKDRIYGKSIPQLTNGVEYSLNDNFEKFFEEYDNMSTTIIYSEMDNSGGGQIAPDKPVYIDTTDASTPTRGDAIMADPVLEPNVPILGKEYVIAIRFIHSISPSPKGELIKDGGAVPAPDYPVFGGSYIEAYTSNRNRYDFYPGSTKWVDDNTGNEVDIEDMPKIKLQKSAILDEDMFMQILGGKEITLEEKLSEGIKTWNYETELTANGVKPAYNNVTAITNNYNLFVDASLTGDQTDTILYNSRNFHILYSFNSSQGLMTIKYEQTNYSTETVTIYTNRIYEGSSNLTSEWGVHTEPFEPEQGAIYAEDYVKSQDELPYIENYFETNITNSDFIPVMRILVNEFSESKATTLEEKIADLKNWTYSYKAESYTLLETINWAGMLEYQELESNNEVYHGTSNYSDGIVVDYNSEETLLDVALYIYFDDHKGNTHWDEYRIYNKEYTDPSSGDTLDANTWYLRKEDWNEQESRYVVTYEKINELPQININKKYIQIKALFDCIFTFNPEYKQTLDEKFSNLKDCAYETIPGSSGEVGFRTNIDWSEFSDIEPEDPNEIYLDETEGNERVIFAMNQDGITDIVVQLGAGETSELYYYLESSTDFSPTIHFEANTWYLVDFSSGETPSAVEQIPAPFEVNEELIKNEKWFNAVYNINSGGKQVNTNINWEVFSTIVTSTPIYGDLEEEEPLNAIMAMKSDALIMIQFRSNGDDYAYINQDLTMSGLSVKANTWTKIDGQTTIEEVPSLFEIDENLIAEGAEDYFNEIIIDGGGSQEKITTLKEKFDEVNTNIENACTAVYTGLDTKLNTEITNRTAAVNDALQTAMRAVNDEITNRTAADRLLAPKETTVAGIKLVSNTAELRNYNYKTSNDNYYGLKNHKNYVIIPDITEDITKEVLEGTGVYPQGKTIYQIGLDSVLHVDYYRNEEDASLANTDYRCLLIQAAGGSINGQWYYHYAEKKWYDMNTTPYTEVLYNNIKDSLTFELDLDKMRVDYYTLSKLVVPVDNNPGIEIVEETNYVDSSNVVYYTLRKDIDIDAVIDLYKQKNPDYAQYPARYDVYKNDNVNIRIVHENVNNMEWYTVKAYTPLYHVHNTGGNNTGVICNDRERYDVITNGIKYSYYPKGIWCNEDIDACTRIGNYPILPIVITKNPSTGQYVVDNFDEDLLKLIAIPLKDLKETVEEKFNSISQFPACPTTTDGTYVLEATVSSGEVTYAWVLKSS